MDGTILDVFSEPGALGVVESTVNPLFRNGW